jgi:hypothetical protein
MSLSGQYKDNTTPGWIFGQLKGFSKDDDFEKFEKLI